ncbi:VOC family protein [Nocardia sp. BMG111209]|uniref:VOC family protein n=1 Tax=Nocardia sp. BMG111209 TaxID=1160137 RepID=UPI00036C9E6A|nr:VOC family protein [Nocardia sp. BMG111209]
MTGVRTYPAGVTSWIDVECLDVEAAKAFYGNIFGWTFADATPPGAPSRYVIAQLAGADVAGIGVPVDPAAARPGSATWNTYVAVDDAQAAADRIVAAGGRVVAPPTPAGEGGILAVCADPTGAGFRLWQAGRRSGAQLVNVPGAWNFSNLRTADPAGSQAFYTEVFGWSIEDLGFATMIRRPGYGDHLAATVDPDIRERQSGPMVPPGFADAIGWVEPLAPGETPRWHVAFTVADRDETASAATRLGGTVLATGDTDWTRDAVIRDPQGATFTASQFTPPS